MSPTETIRMAQWPKDEAAAVQLLRRYGHFLADNPLVSIHMEDYETELASLGELWTLPHGVLLLAFQDDLPAGCVAIKIRADRPGACEMKRLWVEPAQQGTGLGRRLAQAAIDWSRNYGADTLLLDTVAEAMPAAVRLYRSLGFTETPRHNDNPVPDLVFFALPLR